MGCDVIKKCHKWGFLHCVEEELRRFRGEGCFSLYSSILEGNLLCSAGN